MSEILPKLREIQDVAANIEGQTSHLTWLLNEFRKEVDSMVLESSSTKKPSEAS